MIVATVKTPRAGKRSTAARVLPAFAENMRVARVAAGMNQTELGELVSASQSQISHYEKGIRQPNIEELCNLADALGVTPQELITPAE